MKKFLLLTVFTALLMIGFASAFNCSDTDAQKPQWNPRTLTFGSWGNDATLGGTTTGWLDANVSLPEGCTGIWSQKFNAFYNVTCKDFCSGNNLHEFFCSDRQGFLGESIVLWNLDTNSTQCIKQAPEFEPVGIVVALIGGLISLIIIKRYY